MKKIVTLCLTLVFVFMIMANVYAASSFKVSMETSKDEFTKNEEFTVEVKISDIQDEKGIITLGGEIDYDTDSLTLVKVEQGAETWAKPSYSKNSKKFVMDRENRGKEDEVLFKIVFTVNEDSAKEAKISLKNIVGSNGSDDIEIGDVDLTVKVTDGTSKPTTSPQPSESPKPSISTNPSSTTKPSSSANPTQSTDKKITSSQVPQSDNGENTKIPYTGFENSTVLLVVLVSTIALTIFSFIQIRKINKKAKKIDIK